MFRKLAFVDFMIGFSFVHLPLQTKFLHRKNSEKAVKIKKNRL